MFSGIDPKELGRLMTLAHVGTEMVVPIVVGLNWRRGTKQGAIWSMVAGFLGCLIWRFTLQRSFAAHGIDAVEVVVALSAITFVLVSRATPPPPEENLRIFFD